MVMHGTVYALVNNIPEIPAKCKQHDAASFPFHFEVSCTNQLRDVISKLTIVSREAKKKHSNATTECVIYT